MAGLVLCGVGGGIAVEILRFYRIRDDLHKGAPDWSKSWLYWAVTLAMIALGGVLVGLYESSGDVELNGLLAFNIGASAPLIIANLTDRAPSGLRVDRTIHRIDAGAAHRLAAGSGGVTLSMGRPGAEQASRRR